jgi:F-type H+-transporting ATPase subunit epsilon
MTVMPGHTALITTLRPGVLTVVGTDGAHDYAVTGGFAEISEEGVTVLAERGLPTKELTREIHAELVASAQEAHASAASDAVAQAAKLLADMEALGDHITI